MFRFDVFQCSYSMFRVRVSMFVCAPFLFLFLFVLSIFVVCFSLSGCLFMLLFNCRCVLVFCFLLFSFLLLRVIASLSFLMVYCLGFRFLCVVSLSVFLFVFQCVCVSFVCLSVLFRLWCLCDVRVCVVGVVSVVIFHFVYLRMLCFLSFCFFMCIFYFLSEHFQFTVVCFFSCLYIQLMLQCSSSVFPFPAGSVSIFIYLVLVCMFVAVFLLSGVIVSSLVMYCHVCVPFLCRFLSPF